MTARAVLVGRAAGAAVVATRIAAPPLDVPGACWVSVRFERALESNDVRCVHVVSPLLPGRPVPQRLAEYVAGRYCAETALARVTGRRAPVGRRADRAPIWPPGVAGSIAHCGDIAVAAVTSRTSAAGLGIDVESTAPARSDEARLARITTARERAALEGVELDLPELAALVFSAKESVYKCVDPLTGASPTFREVEIADIGCGTFAVRLPPGLPVRLRGTYALVGDLVYTAAWASPRR